MLGTIPRFHVRGWGPGVPDLDFFTDDQPRIPVGYTHVDICHTRAISLADVTLSVGTTPALWFWEEPAPILARLSW